MLPGADYDCSEEVRFKAGFEDHPYLCCFVGNLTSVTASGVCGPGKEASEWQVFPMAETAPVEARRPKTGLPRGCKDPSTEALFCCFSMHFSGG